jgi:TolA-binding protein
MKTVMKYKNKRLTVTEKRILYCIASLLCLFFGRAKIFIWFLFICMTVLHAGILEDAEELYKQGKYFEASEKLESEINKSKPSVQAVSLGIDIALACGNSVEAGELAAKLARISVGGDEAMLLKSAQTAEILGQQKLAGTRYLSYLSRINQEDAKFRHAARYIFVSGFYPEILNRYLQAFSEEGAACLYTDVLIDSQIDGVVKELWSVNEVDKAFVTTELSMDYYSKSGEKVNHLLRLLNENLKNLSTKEHYYNAAKFASKYKFTDLDRVVWLYRDIRNAGLLDDDFITEELLKTLKRSDVKISSELVWGSKNAFPDLNNTKPALAKEFAEYLIANKDAYIQDDDSNYFAGFLYRVSSYDEVFSTIGISAQQIQQWVNELVLRYKDNVLLGQLKLEESFGNISRNYFKTDQERADFLGKYLEFLSDTGRNRLGEYLKYRNSPDGIDSIIEKSKPYSFVNAKYNELEVYYYFKQYNDLPRVIIDYVKANPHYWDMQNAWRYYFSRPNEELTDAGKMQTLNAVFAFEGKSKPMLELLETMNDAGWHKKPEFVEFRKKCMIGEPIINMPAYDIAQRIIRSNDPGFIEKSAKDFLDFYKGRVPGSRRYAKSPMEELSVQVAEKHLNTMRHNQMKEEFFRACDMWIPRVKEPGDIWNSILGNTGYFDKDKLWNTSKIYLEVLKNNSQQPFESRAIDAIAGANVPKDFRNQAPFAVYYKEMGRYTALSYFSGMSSSWDQEFAEKEFDKILSVYGVKCSSLYDFRSSIQGILHRSGYSFTLLQAQKLEDEVFRLSISEIYLDTERFIFNRVVRGRNTKDIEDFVKWYLSKISNRSTDVQLYSINEVVFNEYTDFSPTFYQTVLIPKLNGLLEDRRGSYCAVSVRFIEYLGRVVESEAEEWTLEIKQQLAALKSRLLDEMLTKEMDYTEKRDFAGAARIFRGQLFKEMSETVDWKDIIHGIGKYSFVVCNLKWSEAKQYVETMVSELDKFDKNEITYVFADNIYDYFNVRNDDEMQKYIKIVRAQAARGIKDLIPVEKSDPTYDLYTAVQYLLQGNEVRAWQLTQPKLELFSKNWEKFDVGYNAWVAEQMRKQKMLDEALKLSMTILVKEYDIDAENVADIILVKGDTYRDMGNNAAAKIEYQGLVANRRYADTPAGQAAKYRLIDIMIQTKEYSSAETQLERLLDVGTVEEQADAYYYFAKISFEQGDAEAASEYLKKCFALVHGHVSGRLLEGELKLVLPRGLQDPEVKVGRLDLQTVVVLGKTLTLKLQDSNLSIARGGKSIPVIVTTSSGDKERVELFSGESDTTLFSGSIHTGLGAPTPDNLFLEVNGSDEVSYIIEPEFQKANNIDYPSKRLEVKSEARLVASSGEILSEDDENRRELEQRIARAKGDQSLRYMVRNNKTIRPGSEIYVEVTDFDRDVSNEKDTIFININTSSGDVLNDYLIKETSEHSGIFRGTIPTGLPFPKVNVSDKEEATDPNCVININKSESFKSLADGAKPKWIEVDTMDSYNFKEVDLACKDSDNIRSISLYGMLAQDSILLAKYPENISDIKGGLMVSVASSSDYNEHSLRRTIQYKTFATYNVAQPIFDRLKAPEPLGRDWIVVAVKGAFYLPESRELKLRISSNNNNGDHGLRLSIDGKYVGGDLSIRDSNRTYDLFLNRGIHEFEGLIRSRNSDSILTVEYQKEDGAYAPIPAEWFSIENEALAEKLLPKGKIMKTDNGFKAVITPPMRLRKIRWSFDDFTSTGIEVSSVSAIDSSENKILPVENDFTEGIKNRIVEVSAGEEINIQYFDEKRLNNDMPVKEAQLYSSFADADVGLLFEKIELTKDGKEHSTFSKARRIRRGDQLMAVVTDYDEDLTDDRDTVQLNVTTTSGETLELKLLETDISGRERFHNHSGVFSQILRFGDVTGKNTIKVVSNDVVKATYLDKENTNPGIPFERTYTLDVEERDNARLMVYKTDVKLVEDNSAEAQNKIRIMQQRGATLKDLKIMKEQITATTFSKEEQDKLTVNVNSPILFHLFYPKMAMHADSIYNVDIIADSEIIAAKREGRFAVTNEIPVYIRSLSSYSNSKGFPIKTTAVELFNDDQMLERGLFSGLVRLQIGSSGDSVNKYIDAKPGAFMAGNNIQQFDKDTDKYIVPTILVTGSDTVTMFVRNKKGDILQKTRINLLSDARLELLDRTYSVPMDSIHLGQRFYVKLTDFDHDITDDNDTVTVTVKSDSEDEVELVLKETLPHSGVFTGFITPSFIEKDDSSQPIAPDKTDDILRVNFGDTVKFSFIDNMSMSSDDSLKVSVDGYIYRGADGQFAGFTKRFKDPDMAVKTRFLLAEAKFEVAKEFRKLDKQEDAARVIAEGKRILEEAMRDYPDTTLKAQGEFLLANLSHELGNYQEAIGRYSNVINNWPNSEYAIRSLLRKAICLEKMERFDQACEEYVKLTYLYPDSQYVADASIRMGNYYYKHKQYGISAQIFIKFQKRYPTHVLAAKSMFLAANCLMRMEREEEERSKAINPNYLGDYSEAIIVLEELLNDYKDDKDLCAESMYWLAECYSRQKNYRKAYQILKNLTWEYPESKWAKIARGRLTDSTYTSYDAE